MFHLAVNSAISIYTTVYWSCKIFSLYSSFQVQKIFSSLYFSKTLQTNLFVAYTLRVAKLTTGEAERRYDVAVALINRLKVSVVIACRDAELPRNTFYQIKARRAQKEKTNND